jgi:hypothetical protein
LAREEITVDQLVDVVQGNREYKPCLYLYNKIDTVTIEEIDQLARMPHSIVGSVAQHFNIGGPLEDDYVKQKLWEYLGLTRVYTKRKGKFSQRLIESDRCFPLPCNFDKLTLFGDFIFYAQPPLHILKNRVSAGPSRARCIIANSQRDVGQVVVCQYFNPNAP